jgi:hypothetical protein
MMADKYTSNEVQALADEFIRFKRYVEDVLENLPDMGMTESSVKKLIAKYGETSSAGFEAYADADEAIAKMFAEYKKEINGDINDLQIRSSYIETKADANAASITGLAASVGDNKTNIAMIGQNSNASGAFISLMAMSADKSIDTSKGYTINADGNYVFKDFNGKDVVLNKYDIAGIYISSINQGVESSLTSIKLNADVVEFGDYASVDNFGNLKVKRLYHSSGEQFYAQLGNNTGSFADFGVYDEINNKWAWRFYNDDMAAEVVHLRIYENNIFGYNGMENKTFPKGEWDFSSCSVSNIPLYFS